MAVLEFAPQSSSSSATLSTTKTVSAGSTIVVFAWLSVAAYSLDCTIGGVSAGSPVALRASGTAGELYCWIRENAAAGSTAVVITEVGPNEAGLHLAAYEITNAPAASALDSVGSFGDIGPSVFAADAAGLNISAGATVLAFYEFDRATTLTLSGWTALTSPVATSYQADVLHKTFASAASGERAAGNVSPNAFFDGILVSIKEAGAGDTLEPTLTSPTGTATGSTTASGSVTTDEANGTLYGVVTTSATAPSAAQVQAGQDHAGAAAAYAGSQAITTTGSKTLNATGLTASTVYYWHFQHEDAAGNDSAVVSSASITTDASAANPSITTQPLKNNTGTLLASTTIDLVAALDVTDLSVVATWAAIDTEATGELILEDAALVDATDYLVVTSNAAGTAAGVRKYTASA